MIQSERGVAFSYASCSMLSLSLTLMTPAERVPLSSRLKALGSSCPNGQVLLQLCEGQLAPMQVKLQVEVAETAVLEAKLVLKEMGGKSPPPVGGAPACWPTESASTAVRNTNTRQC